MRAWIRGLGLGIVVLITAGTGWAALRTFEGYPVVNVVVNGTEVTSDTPAIILNGRTMLPVRAIGNALGLNVTWDQDTATVYLASRVSKQSVTTKRQDWWEIGAWQGTGSKRTETFSVSALEWRILWHTTNEAPDAQFLITVFDADGRVVAIASDHFGPLRETSYVRTAPGRYYLVITGINLDWDVSVEVPM